MFTCDLQVGCSITEEKLTNARNTKGTREDKTKREKNTKR